MEYVISFRASVDSLRSIGAGEKLFCTGADIAMQQQRLLEPRMRASSWPRT
jgi:hypothetical protein